MQNTFEFGAAALSVSSKLQQAALTAASEISTAAINATSTLFPPRDRIHLEDTPVGVLHLDDGLRVVLSNPAARALLGRSIAFGEALDQVLPFKDAALREQIDAGIADGGSSPQPSRSSTRIAAPLCQFRSACISKRWPIRPGNVLA